MAKQPMTVIEKQRVVKVVIEQLKKDIAGYVLQNRPESTAADCDAYFRALVSASFNGDDAEMRRLHALWYPNEENQ